ncbi:carbamate kinase [Patulibacter defluvii]|uniref:carbamate kinase n=1 Tax=Patulibacter defluvii TaxID=3095358 RepID=UPI002A7624E4|nr:carbamate kinase [Patulibacter sp. DM4]
MSGRRRPLIVAALGGNALLRRGETPSVAVQRRNVAAAIAALAPLFAEHDVVVTHGNGPQVGLLALRAAEDGDPLDVLGAESEALIGYLLGQALTNALPGREVVTLLTQVVVDGADPALGAPTKPIGPVYDRPTAERLAREHGWSIAPDGDRWRRVVGSPVPREIVELDVVRRLVADGVVVVCTGGGGIPVARDAAGGLRGVEAVVDKDRASALLASRLDADALLLLTDVPALMRGFGTPAAAPLAELRPGDPLIDQLPPGSMRPKVEAAQAFAAGGGRAAIGALADAAAILAGAAGTRIRGDDSIHNSTVV